MRAEREDYVCGEDGGCDRSGAPLIQTSGSKAGGGQRLSRFPVSLRDGLLAFLYHHFTERGGRVINMKEWEQGGRRSKGWLASR